MISRSNTWMTRHDPTPPVDPQSGLTQDQVNSMISGALARFTRQELPKHFEAVTGQLTSLAENLTSLQTSIAGLNQQDKDSNKKKDEISPELNARIQKAEKEAADAKKKADQLEELRKTAEEKALATDQESKIRTELAKFNFVNEEAANDAYLVAASMVSRSGDGVLVANDLPIADFFKDYFPTKKAHLLAPTGRSGSGAQGGGSKSNLGVATTDMIKPGMSGEDLAKVAAAIKSSWSQ